MKKGKFISSVFLSITIIAVVFFFQKSAYGHDSTGENSTLVDELKNMIPEIQSGKKSLSIFQGERVVQSQIRDIRFGGDYFVLQDSVLMGRTINIRKMYIKSSEIVWLVEDQNSISLRLKN